MVADLVARCKKRFSGAAIFVCPSANARKKVRLRRSKIMTPTTAYMASFAVVSGKDIVTGDVMEWSLGAAQESVQVLVREVLGIDTSDL